METQNLKLNKSTEIIDQISVDKLEEIINNHEFTIIDVRGPKGIKNQGAIPGAINVPFDDVEMELDSRNSNPNSVFNREGSFLFCCTGGVMSYVAAIKAKENGIKNVFNLEGGHSAWKKLKEAVNEEI